LTERWQRYVRHKSSAGPANFDPLRRPVFSSRPARGLARAEVRSAAGVDAVVNVL